MCDARFRHSIALDEVETELAIPVDEFDRDCCATGRDETCVLKAQSLQDFVASDSIYEGELKESLELLLGSLLEDTLLKTQKKARKREENSTLRTLEICEKCLLAFGEEYLERHHQRVHLHDRPLCDMCQG